VSTDEHEAREAEIHHAQVTERWRREDEALNRHAILLADFRAELDEYEQWAQEFIWPIR
jgi:hypothetical protein